MSLNMPLRSTREKLILAGLYLAKFDTAGLTDLGFDSFTEAFNVIGYALGGRPASIKNYRDEFDPLFPNNRQGWHKRPLRAHCRDVLEEFGDLDLENLCGLVKSFFGYDDNLLSELKSADDEAFNPSTFAKRLITGLAAERYFELIKPTLPQFESYRLENTTRLGCGYDFRLHAKADEEFLAVEVKGLQARTGSLSLTPKEYDRANVLDHRFFLFVVKNFRETPFHEIYQAPLLKGLHFTRKERVVIQVSWLASV